MSNAPESHHEKSGIRVKVNLAFASLESAGFSLSVDTTIPSTGITAIFGGSGSGKTSLLRFIAGLERPPLGQVSMDEAVWQNDREFVPTYQRPIGYVFQESSLFSHLNAEQNLNFALKRAPEKVEPQFIGRVISIMGISELLKRRPHQLSGGERQRVAIARALLIRPKLLLMDEPLASLDERLKQEILPYLETLKTEFELPILYVSHSMTEVSRLADHEVRPAKVLDLATWGSGDIPA